MFIFLNNNKVNSLKKFLTFYHIFFYVICFTFILITSITGKYFIVIFAHDIFADFFKVMGGLRIIDCWNGENPYLDINLGINFLPPFSIFLYSFFATFIKYSSIKYIYFYFIFLVIIFYSFFVLQKNRISGKVFLLMVFTYPFLINIQRGNFAILVFLFLFSSYLHKRNIFKSIFFLALAICIKITPIVFIIPLLIGESKVNIIRKLILLIIFIFLINCVSIIIVDYLLLNDIYNYKLFFISQAKYTKLMIENNGGLNYGNSIYMPVKFIIQKYFSNSIFNFKFSQFSPYVISIFLSLPFLIIYIYQSAIQKSIKNSVLLEFIAICFILFTPVSADYYLVILFLPLLLNDFSYFSLSKKLLYIIILLPKVLILKNITVSSFINPLLLVVLLLTCIYENKTKINETFAT